MPWSSSFRQTFRLLPRARQSQIARTFLESDGRSPDAILAQLPYDAARSGGGGGGGAPNPKRYRDARQLLRTVGLVYEEDTPEGKQLRVSELGKATRRWMDLISEENCPVLGRHVAFALSACQLRTPSREGRQYEIEVFPFRAIWQVMLSVGGKIQSDEINRAVLRIESHDDVEVAVERILRYRESQRLDDMGPETITEAAKNDRIIVWMCWASFGWMLIEDKDRDGYYRIRDNCVRIVREAARSSHAHRIYRDEAEYVSYISKCAAVPPDLR